MLLLKAKDDQMPSGPVLEPECLLSIIYCYIFQRAVITALGPQGGHRFMGRMQLAIITGLKI